MRPWVVLLLLLWAAPAAAETATLSQGQVLRGHFVQERHLEGFAQPVRSAGSFVLVPGRGLIWQAETPFPVVTVVSPNGLVQSVGGAETTRLPAARLPFLSRLSAMMGGALAGDWGALDADFAVKRETIGPSLRVTLQPLRADDPTAAAIKSIVITVGHYVDTVDIQKPGGDFDHLVFRDQTLSAGPATPTESAQLDAAGP